MKNYYKIPRKKKKLFKKFYKTYQVRIKYKKDFYFLYKGLNFFGIKSAGYLKSSYEASHFKGLYKNIYYVKKN